MPANLAAINLESAMETIRFIGHVFPGGVRVGVTLPDLDWKWEEKNTVLKFRTKINNNTINVECSMDKFEPDYMAEYHKRAFDLAVTAVNLVCFASGEGLITVLEYLILPDGTPSDLRFPDSSLAPIVKSYTLDPQRAQHFQEIANIVVMTPALFAALHDLIQVISTPHVSLVNCGRVVDSIRRLITPGQAPSNWTIMRTALNISRPYLEYVSAQSTGPRHGDRTFVPGTITGDVTRRTWNIMDRFLEYLRRGKVNLTAPEFPELV
jgi:hypothetical protein